MKRWSIYWLAFIIVLAIAARIYFVASVSEVGIYPDSLSYYQTSRLYLERGHVFDPWRVPVYPLILLGIGQQYGMPEPIMGGVFSKVIAQALLLNHLAGVVGTGLFALLLFKLARTTPVSIGLSMYYAINPFTIAFERILLTESLALFLTIILLWIMYFIFKKIRYWLIISLSIWSIIAILLRPSFLLFPFLAVFSMIWLYRSKLSFLAACIVCLISLSTISIYAYGNYIHFQYPSITHVQDINVLGNILRFNIPIPNDLHTNPWGKAILSYRENPQADPQPWRLLEYETALYQAENINILPAFVRSVIIHSPLHYIQGVMLLLPEAITDWGEEFVFPLVGTLPSDHPIHYYVRATALLIVFRMVFVFLLPFIFFLRMPIKQYSAFVLFCVLIGGSTLLLTLAVSYGEYGRLLMIMDPFALLFTALVFRYVKLKALFQRSS